MSWPFTTFDIADKDFARVILSHEITVEVARTAGLLSLLNDLHGSVALRQRMRLAPDIVIAERGMAIPRRGSVSMREFRNGGWELSITITADGYAFINGFSTESGFYSAHHPELV
ncbi:MAG TPA: hypothetical protein VKX45_13725 [Bryobacteraceae bacterium]|jgi:hypothetical protein|nr:hypothetical protein [Bryobacteraceae bacterium]